jgi:hypothetical protein
MADIILFIRDGWKNIWRQNTILLFSALPILNQLFNAFQTKHEQKLFWLLIHLVGHIICLIFLYVSYIGVPYLAYCSSIGKSVTIRETLIAARKFSGRIIGGSCLGILLISPCIVLTSAAYKYNLAETFQTSNMVLFFILGVFPISLFSAMWGFSMFGFFANDLRIMESVEKAWDLFSSHFSILATLGTIMVITSWTYSVISGILTVLIQSGFSTPYFNNFIYLNPYTSLSKNILFVSLTAIGQIILVSFNSSVFASAYLKYSEAKTPSLLR